MGATADLFDAWADLVHGSVCLGCAMPGRPWCRSCAVMLARGITPKTVERWIPGIPGIPGIVLGCAGDYDGWLRDLILAHKERSAWSLAAPLGALLASAIRSAALCAEETPSQESALILVPIPSRRRTVRQRGHDPTLRMTRAAAVSLRADGIETHARRLLRLRLPVQDSVGLTAGQRRRNLDDAFAAISAPKALQRVPRSARIVVCDDVVTTGATLREASAALALAGIPASAAATVAAVGRA